MKKKIRDFIYLDTERVRSYLAQLEDGLQTDRGEKRSHDVATSGEFEVSTLIAKGSGGGSYQYGHASNVNYQAHDEIFDKLLERLILSERLKDAQTGGAWNMLTFGDGEFVSSTCAVKIIDMAGLKTQLTVVPKLMQNIVKTQNAQARNAGKPTPKQNLLDVKKFGQLAEMLDEVQIMLYGDSPVLIKLYPDIKQPEKYFNCTARNAFFREQPAEIARQYGRFFNAGWKCLVLMNQRYFVHKLEKFVSDDFDASDIGTVAEHVQDLFEQHMAQYKQRSDVGNATLLALYREI